MTYGSTFHQFKSLFCVYAKSMQNEESEKKNARSRFRHLNFWGKFFSTVFERIVFSRWSLYTLHVISVSAIKCVSATIDPTDHHLIDGIYFECHILCRMPYLESNHNDISHTVFTKRPIYTSIYERNSIISPELFMSTTIVM